MASGTSPDASPALSLRAQILIGAKERKRLARTIRRLVRDAQFPLTPLTPGVPMCRRKIQRSRKTLQALAERLAGASPVDARGVAQVRLLLCDSSGPLCWRSGADDLEPAVQEAIEALEVRTKSDASSSPSSPT